MPVPAFELDWGGTTLTWSTRPAPVDIGLTYTFAFAEPLGDAIRFCIDPDGLEVSSKLGALRDGVLTVPAGTKTFSVTVGNPEGVR